MLFLFLVRLATSTIVFCAAFFVLSFITFVPIEGFVHEIHLPLTNLFCVYTKYTTVFFLLLLFDVLLLVGLSFSLAARVRPLNEIK